MSAEIEIFIDNVMKVKEDDDIRLVLRDWVKNSLQDKGMLSDGKLSAFELDFR